MNNNINSSTKKTDKQTNKTSLLALAGTHVPRFNSNVVRMV